MNGLVPVIQRSTNACNNNKNNNYVLPTQRDDTQSVISV